MEKSQGRDFARIKQPSPELHSKNDVLFLRPSALQQNPSSVNFYVRGIESMTLKEWDRLQECAFPLQSPVKKLGHHGESDSRASPCQSVSAYF